MLSIEHPALCEQILQYPSGIHCVRVGGESTSRIILKLPINYILPAKVKQGFKVYVVPVDVDGTPMVGLMCAFLDDQECPLVLWRPMDRGDETSDLLHALTRQEVLVHLFDEQNRELLGYRALLELPLMARIRLEHAHLPEITHESANAAHEQAVLWFRDRNDHDDIDAIQVRFVGALFPEDLAIIDVRSMPYQFHGDKGSALTMLERKEPGPHQEIDIILLLQRVFKPEQIYHGPKRWYDKEEIADVVVVTDTTCLIVQAKDSPNTQMTIDRTLHRKRLTSASMVEHAIVQLKGAVKYVKRTQPLRMLIDGSEIVIDIGTRNVMSLAVVRELFIDMYDEYSASLFDFFGDVGLPCIAIDYGELHDYTTFCVDEEGFVGAYFEVFDKARELGEFPRLRFGLRDAERIRPQG